MDERMRKMEKIVAEGKKDEIISQPNSWNRKMIKKIN